MPKVHRRTNLDGNLGCPTSTWNQSPTRSPLSATQNPSFFQPQSIQHHREPSLSSQTGKTSSHFDQLYGPTTGTTHYEQHSKYASRDLCNYHKPSRYCSEIENINSKKKKKNQIHSFNPPPKPPPIRSTTSTRKRAESQHQTADPTNGMTPSHNPPSPPPCHFAKH